MACVASQGQQPGYQSHEPPSPPSAAPPRGPAAPACASSSCCLPPEEEAVLDRIIAELLSVKDARPGTEVHLAEEDIHWVIRRCRETFLSQPMLLEVACPVNVCGDTHGQYHDLLRLFEMGHFPPYSNYIFLGDYVDRAKQSIETMSLLMCYKVKYPESFFLLRGNHECASLNRIYGFYDECKRRYSVKLWRTFSDLFNCMPVAAVIEDKIFCMHGGLSPELRHLSQILQLPRPVDVPDEGILCDLLWADPDTGLDGWGRNPRGVSYLFGHDVVAEFLATHDLDLICRAHQVVEDGYEFQADRQLVTLFSAPNYCGEFDNAGAMMCVNEDLVCSFRVLRPASMREQETSTATISANNTALAGLVGASASPAAATASSDGDPTSPTNASGGTVTRTDYHAPSVSSGRAFVAQRRQEAKGDAIAAMKTGSAPPLRRPVQRRAGRDAGGDDLFDMGEGVDSLVFGEGEDDLDDLGF